MQRSDQVDYTHASTNATARPLARWKESYDGANKVRFGQFRDSCMAAIGREALANPAKDERQAQQSNTSKGQDTYPSGNSAAQTRLDVFLQGLPEMNGRETESGSQRQERDTCQE